MNAPLPFRWDGDAFHPAAQRFAVAADRLFVVGEIYPLVVQEARSQASHSHYFAALHDAWQNLPEAMAERFPTPEHLRKHCLIKAGYANQREFACSSRAEALRLAAFLRPVNEFAIVTVREAVVIEWTAQSQSLRAMGKAAFQDSKQKVLDIVASYIGITADTLSSNAGKAA